MSYRKSFLVFVLAFAALTLGRSQEAIGQEWDWGGPAPGSIDGGSTVLVYKCDQGGQGTNTLTQGATAKDPDIFTSKGTVLCDFGKLRGEVKGNDILCSYELTFTGDLWSCVNTPAGAVVTVKSTCDNVKGVSGHLSCAAQADNLPTPHPSPNPGGMFPAVTDLLGISSKNECEQLFGKNTNTLFTQATYAGQNCTDVMAITNTNEGLKFGGLTKTTTNVCHGDATITTTTTPVTVTPLPVDCIPQGSTTGNKSTSDIPNLIETKCDASPQTWNADCSGNKDQGNGRVCYLNGQAGFASFDPTKLAAGTATLNGVPVDKTKQGQALCQIKDCNGDGVLDFECSFPTCSGGNAVAAPPLADALGELTMITSFSTTDASGLTCTTTVATSGQLP
jgi:hypothetical protein